MKRYEILKEFSPVLAGVVIVQSGRFYYTDNNRLSFSYRFEMGAVESNPQWFRRIGEESQKLTVGITYRRTDGRRFPFGVEYGVYVERLPNNFLRFIWEGTDMVVSEGAFEAVSFSSDLEEKYEALEAKHMAVCEAGDELSSLFEYKLNGWPSSYRSSNMAIEKYRAARGEKK